MIRSASQACKKFKSDLPKLSSTNPTRSRLNLSSHQSIKSANKKPKRPRISSDSWIITSINGRVIDSHNASQVREMASLTKIMTCIIVIEETMRNRRSFHEIVRISEQSVNVIGTKAGLQAHDSLKVWDLLHALMLPSGNDAALALAEFIGKLFDPASPVSGFISKMNAMAKGLKLDVTTFGNPHGLSNLVNLSNAKNLACLVSYAMGNMLFRKVVGRRNYECMVFGSDGPRKVSWENTNKLLYKGFCGVKTGFTPSAGPCLACCYEKDGKKIVVILLRAKTMNSRWTEALRLVKWAFQDE